MSISVQEWMSNMDGAKVVRYDENHEVLLVWSGGHGIHGYEPTHDGGWNEVVYWMTGGGERDAEERDVQVSITEHIAMPDEDYWSFC